MPMPRQPQREAALLNGERVYLTGKPCKHGHVGPRFTADSSCVACREAFRESYRERAAIYAREKREAALAVDPAGVRAAWADWQRQARAQNPAKFRARDKTHSRMKRLRNPKGKLAEVRARQAAKIQRTPPWADLKAIRAIYEACPPGQQVDHVIPLRGKNVSGLHVEANLQYLTPIQNLEKGSRFP